MKDLQENMTELTATPNLENFANQAQQPNFAQDFKMLESMMLKYSVGQFRHAEDSSDNLLHPAQGFLSAIKCDAADSALDWYITTPPTAFVPDGDVIGLQIDLQLTAQHFAQNHHNPFVRDFADRADDWLIENPYNALAQLETGEEIGGALSIFKNSLENAKIQARRNDDTSKSIFSPSANLVDVYYIPAVQEALGVLKDSLPSDYMPGIHVLTREQSLIFQGWNLANDQPEPQVKEFALAIVNYMLAHVPESRRLRPNPLRQLSADEEVQEEEDVLKPLQDDISELSCVEKIIQHAAAVIENSEDDTARTLALSVLAHFAVDAMEESGELMALIVDNSFPGSLH